MDRKFIILQGDPRNNPEKEYLYLLESDTNKTLFRLVQNNFLNEKKEILITDNEILKLAEFIKSI